MDGGSRTALKKNASSQLSIYSRSMTGGVLLSAFQIFDLRAFLFIAILSLPEEIKLQGIKEYEG